MAIFLAIVAPMKAPITIARITKLIVSLSVLKKSTETNVANTAIIIPTIPKILPRLDDSGDESPLSAVINKIPDIT